MSLRFVWLQGGESGFRYSISIFYIRLGVGALLVSQVIPQTADCLSIAIRLYCQNVPMSDYGDTKASFLQVRA